MQFGSAARSPFSLLRSRAAAASIAPGAAAAADDDDDKKKKEEDEKAKKKAEEDKKKEDEAAAKKAEEDDKKKKDEEAKKKAEDEEDDEPEALVASARVTERARIRAIAESDAGIANPDAAYELALNTDMPPDQAIATLRAIGPARADNRRSLDDRMAGVRHPDVPSGEPEIAEPGSVQATVERMTAAYRKARGEK
jgi:hypothetical protein